MAKVSRYPFYLLFIYYFVLCLSVLASWNHSQVSASSGSETKGAYLDHQLSMVSAQLSSDLSLDNWDFGGSSSVLPGVVRLTNNVKSQAGFLYCKRPMYHSNWEVKFYFHVHGNTGHLYGDGFAFWYTSHRLSGMKTGEIFGNMDYFTGLAVIFDTYSNHNGEHHHGHPYISAMVNNGTVHYDHDTDGTHTEFAGCEASFRNPSEGEQTHARIVYLDFTLSVYLYTQGKQYLCFQRKGVYLPIGYHLGFSAATGALSDNHDIERVLVYRLPFTNPANEGITYATPSVQDAPSDRPHVDDDVGHFSSTFWVLLLLFIFALVGYIAWMKHREKANKRFF
eukprot:Sdes_comp15337_c0_seq1m4202